MAAKHSAIVLLALLAAPCAAQADELVLPSGTEIRLPADATRPDRVIKLDRPHFLIERESIDRANAQFEISRRLTESLRQCTSAAIRMSRPDPGWQIAAKWAAIGGALVLSFGAGAALF